MPAKSEAQQQAAGIALAAKRGDIPKSKLRGASLAMSKMATGSLRHFAKTKHTGLPSKKTSEAQVNALIHQLLEDEEEIYPGEERQEIAIARNIIQLADQLRASLDNPTPEAARALTGIRAAAHQLVRLHSLGTRAENLP
jgi:hypothetical protein